MCVPMRKSGSQIESFAGFPLRLICANLSGKQNVNLDLVFPFKPAVKAGFDAKPGRDGALCLCAAVKVLQRSGATCRSDPF
jgi:hypothetical protein